MFKDYLITWTDIYNDTKIEHVKLKKPTKDYAINAIRRGDIFKTLDKIEEAIWDNDLKKFITKVKPYAHSKVPIYDSPNNDFIEYSTEYVPNQGGTDFEEAYNIAIKLIKDRPDTVLMYEDGTWWVGKMQPINKNAQIRQNYDYGEGLYQNLNKYKSVSDFRAKRRNKRKKDIANILNSRPDRYKAK